MSRGQLTVAVGFTLLIVVNVSAAEQWPQFRGSNGAVANDHATLPDTWSETENVVWKTDIPGRSWSSPIVWEDHVFVTTAISRGAEPEVPRGLTDPTGWAGLSVRSSRPHRWVVYDIDVDTGAIRWERELHGGGPPVARRHVRNSYASETPVTDGEQVYVYSGNVGLVAALDLAGNVIWTTNFDTADRYGWGHAASPVLHDDQLFIVNDNVTPSFIAAFDTHTGAKLWNQERNEVQGYATPFVWENELRTEIVTNGGRAIRSYDLDGTPLWELTGNSAVGIPTPFARHGLVYISSGVPGDARRPVFAVRPGGAGDLSLEEGETTNEFIAWFQPRIGSYQTSALVYGDYYYTLLDRGLLWCHDARTGEEVYPRQRVGVGSQFAASPWAYNGKIFLLSEDGDTYVVQAGAEFEILGVNSLDEVAMATPAVAQGSLFIRTQSRLYRIQQEPGE